MLALFIVIIIVVAIGWLSYLAGIDHANREIRMAERLRLAEQRGRDSHKYNYNAGTGSGDKISNAKPRHDKPLPPDGRGPYDY